MDDSPPEPTPGATVATTDADSTDADDAAGPKVDVGVLVADSPRMDYDRLAGFARRLAGDAGPGRSSGAARATMYILYAHYE